MILIFPPLHDPQNVWQIALPAFDSAVLLSHFVLLHNIQADWSHRIDPPMWSVATEWEIYFLFPVFLAGRRWLGEWAPLGLGLVFAVTTWMGSRLIGGGYLNEVCPWLAWVFTMGMAASVVGFSDNQNWRRQEERLPWGLFAFSLTVVAVLTSLIFDRRMPADCIMGMASACLLIACTRRVNREEMFARSWIVRFFESWIPRFLGTFSYSLYLVHFPVISLCDGYLRGTQLSESAHYALLLGLSLPLGILLSYGFFLLFERPFLPRHPRSL